MTFFVYLGNFPLVVKIEGENIPSVNELELRYQNLTTDDLCITFVKEGSIVVGLELAPSALHTVGYFLGLIDSLVSSLLQSHPKFVNGCISHVIVSVDFREMKYGKFLLF